jgi:chromatin remodeling complex protein RSC6
VTSKEEWHLNMKKTVRTTGKKEWLMRIEERWTGINNDRSGQQSTSKCFKSRNTTISVSETTEESTLPKPSEKENWSLKEADNEWPKICNILF